MKKLLTWTLALCLLLCLPLGAPAEETVDYWGRYEEPVKVRLAVNGEADDPVNPFTWDDNIWTQAWKDEFNIEVEIMWDTATDDAYNTKMSLAILSGDLPDYIVTANYNQFLQLVDAGMAKDITEMFETWSYPTLYENLNMDGESQAYGVIDGVRYGINTSGGMSTNTRLIYIRNDYLEQVGAAVPTTMEEVVALGKQFVDEGLAKYALPLLGNVSGEGYSDIQAMANAFGAYPKIWIEQGEEMVYGSIQPGMETALNVFKDLFDGGYIDPTFATAVGDTLTAQILNGEIGILMGDFWVTTWPLPDLKDEDGKVVDWTILPVLPSEENDDFRIQGGASTGKMIVIREGYEHPEAIFKLMNHRCAMLDDVEMANMDFQEIVKDDETKIQNHMRCPIREYFNFPYINMYASPAVTKAIDEGDHSDLDRPQNEVQYNNVMKYIDAVAADDLDAMNANWGSYKLFYGENSAFGSFYKAYEDGTYIFDATGGYQSLNYSRLWGTLTQYENTFYVNYIGGTEPTTFEEFQQTWMDMGGELLTYELNNR